MTERIHVAGTVRVPGDKSISHRALMLAALATGTSRIRGILTGEDVQSTARVLRALGVAVPELGPEVAVTGVGRRGLRAPPDPLDCGNSGTTTRLLAGIVAGAGIEATFTGDASLSSRPMARIAAPLEQMGARVTFEREPGRLPMRVRGGSLRPLTYESPTASAQIKSSILLAAVTAGIESTVCEPERSRDHTERMLRAMGVELEVSDRCIAVKSVPDALAPLDLTVPGDPSSAAYFLALAALSPEGLLRVRDVLLNPTRVGFVDALRRMGADLTVGSQAVSAGEEVGDLVVSGGTPLTATTVQGVEVPTLIDELPLLACVAACADGETMIRGAREMRVKESDRIAVTVSNLRALGVEASELPDGMTIFGRRGPLVGSVRTHDDHRIAMSFGVLAALPGNEIEIDNPGCVAISYPTFWRDLRGAMSGGTERAD